MSELKRHHINEVMDMHNLTRGEMGYSFVYYADDADKVIEELKDDCAYWKTMSRKCADDNEVMAKQRADAFKRVRHNKYKRCLAMAKICCEKKENCYNRALRKYSKDEADYLVRKSEFWQDRELRWLKIAEKFKEAK